MHARSATRRPQDLFRKFRFRPAVEALEDRNLMAFNFVQVGAQVDASLDQTGTAATAALNAASKLPLLNGQLGNLNSIAEITNYGDALEIALAGITDSGDTIPVLTDKIQTAVFNVLGPSGRNLIVDHFLDADTAVNKQDVIVTLDAGKTTLSIDVLLRKNGTFTNVGGSFEFGVGLESLPIQVEASGGVRVDVDFDHRLAFTYTTIDNLVRVDTAKTLANGHTVSIAVAARIVAGSTFSADVGFLHGTLTDVGTVADPTHLTAAFHLDVGVNSSITATVVSGSTDVFLHADLGLSDGAATLFPSIGADFVMSYDFNSADLSSESLDIRFKDITLNLGELLSSVVAPVLQQIQNTTLPMIEILDILNAPLPGISELSNLVGGPDISLMFLADLIGDVTDTQNVMGIVTRVTTLLNAINSLPTSGAPILINLSQASDFILSGAGQPDPRTAMAAQDPATSTSPDISAYNVPASMADNDTVAYNSVSGQHLTVVQSIQAASGGNGLTFPILTNPATAVAKLLLGKDTNLIAFDKDFVLNANMSAGLDGMPDFKVFDLDVEYQGGLQITGGLHLGYDTFGLRKAIGSIRAGNDGNVGTDMLQGFYIDEASTGFSVSGTPFTAEAGVNVGGFFDVSIDGSVIVTLTLHPHEGDGIGNDDGKIRFHEIDPDCLFTVSGELTGNLAIEVAVGFDTPIGFIGWRDSFDIATISLLNFGTGICIGMFSGDSPEIAGLTGNVLMLYMGAQASLLEGFDAPANGDEKFVIEHVSGVAGNETIDVTAYGYTQRFTGVATIIADGGLGNDLITVKLGVLADAFLHGGAGNDTIAYFGSGTAVIHGNAGNDKLKGGAGTTTIHGDDGDDILIGGQTATSVSHLFGGAGNDFLQGGINGDTLDGGAGNDQLDAGKGANTINGGADDDRITVRVGDGVQAIFGDGGSDLLIVLGGLLADTIVAGSDINSLLSIQTLLGAALRDQFTGDSIERLSIEGGPFTTLVRIDDLSGTTVAEVAVNHSEAAEPDNVAETVEVHGSADGERIGIDLVPAQDAVGGAVGTLTRVQFLDENNVLRLRVTVANGEVGDNLIVAAGEGDDDITVHTLSEQGAVTVQGEGGDDRIIVNDTNHTQDAVNYVLTPTSLTSDLGRKDSGLTYDGGTEFLRLDGTDGINVFTVSPSQDTEYHIDGNLPAPGLLPPPGGDYLKLDTTGTTGRKLHIASVGAGFWGFTSDHQRVNFESIERFNHVDIVAVAQDAGTTSSPYVNVYDAETMEFLYRVTPYEATFRGGVRVATGDVNFDGIPDLITAPGTGRSATIKVYNGTPDIDAHYAANQIASFEAYASTFRGGAYVAVGDVNRDGANDIVTGPGKGLGPQVKVFNGTTLTTATPTLVGGKVITAFGSTFKGGVTVAVGDINKDGYAEVVAGTGPGAKAAVRVFDGKKITDAAATALVRTVNPFSTFNKGVFVTVGDFNGDGFRDIIVGAGAGTTPRVYVYSGADVYTKAPARLAAITTYATTFRGGVRVAAKPLGGGDPGAVERVGIFTAPGANSPTRNVRRATFNTLTSVTLIDQVFMDPTFIKGALIG
ncbi:MAG: FG-GAP repeat protein [Planctomycetia bacterium]|nr:FG-GAP repeat protein [Planctomycetia bacterium]